jgi:hypothetical protein
MSTRNPIKPAPKKITEDTNTDRTLQRVAMNLTRRDIENTDKVRAAFHARNNAQAVSSALSLVVSMTEMLDDGGMLMVRDKHGELQRVVIPGLN